MFQSAPTNGRTPADSVEKLSTEFITVCRLPDTQQYFAKLGAISMCGGSAMMDKLIADDSARWAQVIKNGGIKIE